MDIPIFTFPRIVDRSKYHFSRTSFFVGGEFFIGYCILYKYGGLYMDIKIRLIIPIDKIIKNKDWSKITELAKQALAHVK